MALDFIEDLEEFAIPEIEAAIREYRRNPKNKYFPTPGQLRELAIAEMRHRNLQQSRGDGLKPQFGDSRPIRWWYRPREKWNASWREADIPQDEITIWQQWRKRQDAA